MPTTVLSMINDGLREVKEAVNSLSSQVSEMFLKLPSDYVPRREVERQWDKCAIDMGALRAELQGLRKAAEDAEETRRKEAEAAAEKHRSERWQRLVLTVGTGMSAVGVLSGAYLHFH